MKEIARTGAPAWLKKFEAATGRSVATASSQTILAVDASGSMAKEDKIGQARRGALAFARKGIAAGYRIGLITFSAEVDVVVQPSKDVDELAKRLRQLEAGGSTNMHGAIEAAARVVGRTGTRVLCLVTDGAPDDPDATLEAARNAKASGIRISAVGTTDADWNFLSRITSEAADAVFTEAKHLEKAIENLTLRLPKP